MEKLYVIKAVPLPISSFDLVDKILKNLPPDLIACMQVGCDVDVTYDDKGSVTVSTRYPVSILKNEAGQIISIIVDKGNLKKKVI